GLRRHCHGDQESKIIFSQSAVRNPQSGECRVPGGPRGLQNRCRFRIPGTEVGSIPILSALTSFVILSGAKRSRRIPWQYRKAIHRDSSASFGMTNTGKEVTLMSREQIRRLTSLSSCAG